LYYLVGLVGPASGYLLGGIIVNIYVDLDKPKELSPDDTNLWVGAWWIGFLISGSISLMGVLPMFGFPKSFRGSARKRAARTEESYGDSAQRSAQLTVTMKDFLPTAGIIFSIPTFVCLTLAGTAASITITEWRPSTATLTIGLVSVPCGALGLFTGAMVIRFVAMPVQRLIWMNVGASTIALASSFVVRCSPQLLAGVTAPYPETQFVPDMDPNFSAPCNYNCSCVRNKFMFDPVCSRTGCCALLALLRRLLRWKRLVQHRWVDSNIEKCIKIVSLLQKRYYTNCSCVTTTKLMHDRNISAISGDCPSTECTSAPLFLTLVGCFMFCMFFITIPTLQAIMRSATKRQERPPRDSAGTKRQERPPRDRGSSRDETYAKSCDCLKS
uniref:Solute carrier organic anion transporter family member n=1 Tax=Macrostomum lignano TaxID=282301 RepID=A0A1I8JLK6_9PLAT